MSEYKCVKNTDIEIWRKQGNDPMDTDNYYQPSIKVTIGQGIMLCVGGTCITKPIEDWFKLANITPVPILEHQNTKTVEVEK